MDNNNKTDVLNEVDQKELNPKDGDDATSPQDTEHDDSSSLDDNGNNGTKKKSKDKDREEKLISEQEAQFKHGEPLTFVKVRFPGNAKSFPFMVPTTKKFAYGQRVVAMSDRGVDVGYINSFPYEVPFNKSMLPIRTILKGATKEDLEKQRKNIHAERSAENICIDLIEKYNLDMNLTHVEFIQFGKKAVFYFTAPQRVDFRELVKDLVSQLKMRIELRQISVRDRTAALGAIAPCGRQNCCSSFLKRYGNTSIKMAKNQNLALIPSKINGVCGQIKCCIRFEEEVYSKKRALLPKEGSFIKAKNGDQGRVFKLHLLPEQFDMLTDTGKKRRYSGDQYQKNVKLPPEWSFPTTFDHIVDETDQLIGEQELYKTKNNDPDQQNAETLRVSQFRNSTEKQNQPELKKTDELNKNKNQEEKTETKNSGTENSGEKQEQERPQKHNEKARTRDRDRQDYRKKRSRRGKPRNPQNSPNNRPVKKP